MSEDEQPDDEVLDAPDRGSADELLDAGAHTELDAMRHSTAHVMAEAVMDLFPGTRLGIGPAIDGRLLLRLRAAPSADARRPGRDRDAHGRERRGRSPVRPRRALAGRGSGVLRRARPALQGRDPRRPGGPGRGGRRAAAAGLDLPARSVHRPVQGPPRREHRPDRPVQAAQRGRGVLARRRAPADAPADLRHGVDQPGKSSSSTCGAGPRPRSATTAGSVSSSTCSASMTSARARPSGIPRASASGARSRRPCASSRTATATKRSRRRSWSTIGCGSSRATGTTTGTPCSCSTSRVRPTRSSR